MIIDFHTHILPDEFRSEKQRILKVDKTFNLMFGHKSPLTVSGQDLISEMDSSGVDVAVVLGYGWTDQGVARTANDYLIETATSHPKRIKAFCSVNPLWGDSAVAEIERCAALGAYGVGELHADTQGFTSTQEDALRPFMQAAADLGLIVLIHGSEPLGHIYPGKGRMTPDRLLSLAQIFPQVRFVFAHWGGGLPFYALMPEVDDAINNTWFDSAASPYVYKKEIFDVASRSAGPQRLLFGSDYPLVSQSHALSQLRAAGLGSKRAQLVQGENAAVLLGLRNCKTTGTRVAI